MSDADGASRPEARSGVSGGFATVAASPLLVAGSDASVATAPLFLAEASVLALGLASVGLVAAHRLGVLHRFRASSAQRVVERAIESPDSVTADDVDSLLRTVTGLAPSGSGDDVGPPAVDPERVRQAINAVRGANLGLIGDRADRFGAHLDHRHAPIRVGVSFALAEVAREAPDRVWPHADAVERRLADEDPTVRQNAVWCFRWLVCEYAGDLGPIVPAILDRYDDPNPDVRANVVTFCTEFAHDAPSIAVGLAGLEGRLRLLATDDALDRDVQHDALLTADYVKSLRQDPAVRPTDGRASGSAGVPEAGETIELAVAEAEYDAEEPVVRGPVDGVDVAVTDPPEGLSPLDRIRVAVEEVGSDAGVQASFVETLE